MPLPPAPKTKATKLQAKDMQAKANKKSVAQPVEEDWEATPQTNPVPHKTQALTSKATAVSSHR